MKDSFIFYKSWGETIKELPEDYKCKVMDALIDYAFEGKQIDDLEQLVKAILKPMCSEIDKNTEKYNKKVENMKNNSRNQNEIEPKSSRNRNENTPKSERNRTEIDGDNDNDNDNENGNVNANDLKETPSESVSKKKTSKKESPVYFPDDQALDDNFKEFIKMRKQIKAPMTERAISMAVKKLTDLSGGDSSRAIKILDQSILNSWKDLYPLKESPPDIKKDLSTKTYNFADLEQRLLAKKRI